MDLVKCTSIQFCLIFHSVTLPNFDFLHCKPAIHNTLLLCAKFLASISQPKTTPCPSYYIFQNPIWQSHLLQIYMSLIFSYKYTKYTLTHINPFPLIWSPYFCSIHLPRLVYRLIYNLNYLHPRIRCSYQTLVSSFYQDLTSFYSFTYAYIYSTLLYFLLLLVNKSFYLLLYNVMVYKTSLILLKIYSFHKNNILILA